MHINIRTPKPPVDAPATCMVGEPLAVEASTEGLGVREYLRKFSPFPKRLIRNSRSKAGSPEEVYEHDRRAFRKPGRGGSR
jgi:hypothetical protein